MDRMDGHTRTHASAHTHKRAHMKRTTAHTYIRQRGTCVPNTYMGILCLSGKNKQVHITTRPSYVAMYIHIAHESCHTWVLLAPSLEALMYTRYVQRQNLQIMHDVKVDRKGSAGASAMENTAQQDAEVLRCLWMHRDREKHKEGTPWMWHSKRHWYCKPRGSLLLFLSISIHV